MNVETLLAGHLETTLSIPTYVGVMPDDQTSPDKLISVYMTGSAPSDRTFQRGATIYHPYIQIIVRDKKYELARDLAWQVHNELDGRTEWTLETVRIMAIQAMQLPFPSGKDSQDRKLFSHNYQLWIEP